MKMEKPTVEAVRFGSRDVIATSGELGVMLGGFGDGMPGWFVSNEKGAKSGTQKESTISEYFQAASGKSDFGLAFNTGSDTKSFENIAANGDINTDYAEFNGWYIWYNDEFVWQSN